MQILAGKIYYENYWYVNNNRVKAANGNYVGHYRCASRTCCTKTMKMTVNSRNDDVIQTITDTPHTCDPNYNPVTKKSKKLDSGLIDLTEEMQYQAETFALENPKLSGKQVADKIFKDIELKYTGIHLNFLQLIFCLVSNMFFIWY